MQTKLTVRIDDALIKKAKQYSKNHQKSLSQLIADFFLLITNSHGQKLPDKLPPLTHSLQGILNKHKIHKKDYLQYLEDKYR